MGLVPVAPGLGWGDLSTPRSSQGTGSPQPLGFLRMPRPASEDSIALGPRGTEPEARAMTNTSKS